MYFYYDKKTFQVKMIAEEKIDAKKFAYKKIKPTIKEKKEIEGGSGIYIKKGKLSFKENPTKVKAEMAIEKGKLKKKIENNEEITNEDIANLLTKL